MSDQDFLGTGWAFPPSFGAGGGEVQTVSGDEDVHQSLAILVATRRGERPMQESFGCNLDDMMFEEITSALANRIESLLTDAILAHETRILLQDVDISQDPDDAGTLIVQLDYTIAGTNSRYNMVFPFYLNEATAPGI